MAEVYKFKVKLCELEEKIWRDIEISSLSTVSKMAYTVLAAFGANGSHLIEGFLITSQHAGIMVGKHDDVIEPLSYAFGESVTTFI